MLIKNIYKRVFPKGLACRSFHLLTPEEYFINMKESQRKLGIDSAKLLPMPEASIK
jgi:hypothetical protein